ncbi:PH-interacting protein like [Argiope bruennichi]|uniref:PH-interacting protein like n=1 Tax=Argiope bruennichi TaxID=94029 RepID=A0A8T0ER52_ARGBR|nr:PH-interacting protein like [Argiope bruennichi]
MAVNHENTLLAAGSCDKTIRVWCLRTTVPVAVLCGHTGMVTSLQFSPYPKSDDRLLISTGNDGCVCFWHWNHKTNAFNPKPLKFTERNKANAQMICSSFSSGGLFLATGSTDNNVRVYNIAGANGPEKVLEREVHTDRVDSIQFSNRDCRFISGSKDGSALIWKYERQNWSTIQLKMSTKLPGQSEEQTDAKQKLMVTMVSWALDDDKVITAVSDHSIKVWNSFNGNLIFCLKGHEDEVFVLEPHPTDSRVFLSSGHDGRIILWDLISGTIIKNHFNLIEGQGHGAVFDSKFSPDGLMFASTDSHGHLSIFGFGSADRYKKVPEEQFFHTDYRPVIHDMNHHVLDEQTQTAPHLLPPPFLVDIDGNPYPPNIQRLVPGREHQNDSQLVPYVAVSAEGDSEILEPVRPSNDNDRPTIDDMIERLQQERNQNMDQNRRSNDGASSSRSSVDLLRSPHSSHRSVNGNDDRNAHEPFSPRTPRSQASHSRVGLRQTGEREGVQSVGNWQSRGTHSDVPSWVKRVVVKPMDPAKAEYYIKQREMLADNEKNFFNREKKKRPVTDRSEESRNEATSNLRSQRRIGARAGLRSRTQEDVLNNAFGEEFENPDNVNSNSTSDSETEEQEGLPDSSEGSESDYSDWANDAPASSKPKPKPEPQPSTSTGRRPASLRQIKPRRRLVSSDDDLSEGDAFDNDDETSENKPEISRRNRKQAVTPKKKIAANGKKLPERFRPPEWLTDVMPHKAPYVPQIGDEIVYFRQGHELYVQAVKRNRIYDIYMRSQPWRKINLRDQEVARIEDITFENHPPRLCCLKLSLLNPAEKCPESFIVKYHDMADVIDFIILKQNYDQAMHYDWKPGDRFRSAIDKAWWLGTIKAQKPLNPNFPDSMFQCFLVKWDNGEKEHMSPWDFEPIDSERLPEEEGGSVEITPEERMAMMYVPEPHEWSEYGMDYDCERIARGLGRIMELSIAESFVAPVDLNLYPSYAIVVEYPMDLGTIKARVQNRFYRRLDAIKFDVRYIEINALKFNEPGSRIVKQAKCVVDLCIRFINSSHCTDPMVLYNDMMEAKQSRSQDSQSELDVLCSEIDSDAENDTSTRIKRRKQKALQQSSKRVCLQNQKYTSNSWRQQCAQLLTTFFQCDDSTPFRHPVNLIDYPDYRNIIDIPMDLTTVRERLSSNYYSNPTEFCKDMRLIFQNSRNYNTNKKSKIYSMTIRLSAMFEEHIRGIISDWRSAVKYEEKIRNNQYVSNRRKPIPSQEAGVNIGASTSRTVCQPSTSRGESSRSSRYTSNSISESLFRNHTTKFTNGAGPKKKIKEETQLSKNSSVRMKKKILKPSIGVSLSNGTRKPTTSVQKRKAVENPPKRISERTKKKELLDEEGYSQSDSNNSSHSDYSTNNSRSGDAEWNQSSKRCRKDATPNLLQKSLRPRINKNRPTRTSYHQKSSIYRSSLRNHTRTSLPRSRSSSPESGWTALKKRTNRSPLHTRSKRLCNSTVEKPDYRDSGSSSDSDEEESESQSFKSEKNSNSSGSSSKSSLVRTRTRGAQNNIKNQQSGSSSESEQSDENSQPQVSRRPTRIASRGVRALTARLVESPQKSGRIVTRNRGVRTVQYQEGDSDESENDESMQSNNSRGSLRSLTNGDEQTPAIRKRIVEKSMGNEEGLARKASSSALDGPSAQSESDNSNHYLKNNDGSSKLHTRMHSYAKPYKGYLSSIPQRTRSAMNKEASPKSGFFGISKAYKRNLIRKASARKESDTDNDDHVYKSKVSKWSNTSSYGLRKCSKLIKRSVYRNRPYSSLIKHQNNASVSSSTPFRRRGRPSLLSSLHKRTMDQNSENIQKKLNFVNQTSRKVSMRIKRNQNRNNYSPISLNTRSKLHLLTEKESLNAEETMTKRIRAPTIVFCKPNVSAHESDSKYKLRTIYAGSSSSLDFKDKVNSTLNEKQISSQNSSLKVENFKPLHSRPISSHTRSSNSFSDNQNEFKKQVPNEIGTKKILFPPKADNYNLKGHKTKSPTIDNSHSKEMANSSMKENANDILGYNKSKWCLRKPNMTRVSARISHNSNAADPSKIQTRNRGQRTVIYNEDDNNYLTEIFENEDPIKLNQRHNSNDSDDTKESLESTLSDSTRSSFRKMDCKDKSLTESEKSASSTRKATFHRPKKDALKISNGIETRNHGQRTTVYAEDADDYLEEYFESLES